MLLFNKLTNLFKRITPKNLRALYNLLIIIYPEAAICVLHLVSVFKLCFASIAWIQSSIIWFFAYNSQNIKNFNCL